jgi:hypothetical protein
MVEIQQYIDRVSIPSILVQSMMIDGAYLDIYRKVSLERNLGLDETTLMAHSRKPIYNLRPKVVEWLEDNVKFNKEGQGWAIGSDEYRLHDGQKFTIWFQRKSDAQKFIKTWSSFKKATSFYNHFNDTNTVLNLETMKYQAR